MALSLRNKICLMAMLVCGLCSAAWFISDMVMGGSARYGRIVNQQYFVSSHGNLKEVTKEMWYLNIRLNSIARVTVPLFFLLIFVCDWKSVERYVDWRWRKLRGNPSH